MRPVSAVEVLDQAALAARQSGDPSVDGRAWTAVGDLMRESYLPPAQRAAVFQAAELIPGVTLVRDVQDAAGRTGIAVARVDDRRGLRDELIFNPATYLYQGERVFVVDPAKADAAVPVPVATGQTPSHAAAPASAQLVSTAE